MRALILRTMSYAVTAGAVLACVVLVTLMLLTTADVVGRYFFNAPIRGVFDLTHFAVLIMAFASFAYAGYYGSHIVIELLYSLLGPRAKSAIRRSASFLGFVLFAVIAWRSVLVGDEAKMFKMSSQLMLIPFWPFYYFLAAGAALYALVLLLYVFVPEPVHGESERSEPL